MRHFNSSTAWWVAVLSIAIGVASRFTAAEQRSDEAAQNSLVVNVRSRQETAPGSGRYHVVTQPVAWNPRKTALIICDMWDRHWCQGATDRVSEMAPRMNAVIRAARERGALIIHAPSETMEFYKNTPQRKLVQAAPPVPLKQPVKGWCARIEGREPALPIDDSDGGCDSGEATGHPWTRQIAAIEIREGDAITDSVEAHYLIAQRGIEHVVIMGVHTNMCVLGRPFSIRQMVAQGRDVVLMRDMTDTMYNPHRAPYVSHFTGTDLVVEHIEKYWCPTITSSDFVGGQPFHFAADHRPHLVMVISEPEYRTQETLPAFAAEHLGKDFRVSYVFGSESDPNDLPGLEVLNDVDLALFSIRRRALSIPQMQIVKSFLATGKPLVAIRTSSHAFGAPEHDSEHVIWPEFDREVLGCSYQGHYDNKDKPEESTFAWVAPETEDNPIVKGLPSGETPVPSSLYKSSPLARSAKVLMLGRAGDRKPSEPVAWTYTRDDGGRVFYTSLGHPDEFKMKLFQRLLRGGIYWAASLDRPAVASDSPEPSDGCAK